MMTRVVVLFVLMMIANLGKAQVPAEHMVKQCYAERLRNLDNDPIDVDAVFGHFEQKLLASGYLANTSRDGYSRLIADLLNDDVRVPVNDWAMASPDLASLAMNSNLTAGMLCFQQSIEDSRETPASMLNMSPYLDAITQDYNLGMKHTDIGLVRAISDADFEKTMYKVPVLLIIHGIAQYKEEMYQLTLNY